jgi:hypothetical protein
MCVFVRNSENSFELQRVVQQVWISNNFIPVSLNLEITKMLPEIKLSELHDRIIVATAKILKAKLITED